MLNHIAPNNPAPDAAASTKPNTPDLDHYKKLARQYGALAGAAADSQMQYGLQLLEGGYHGALDVKPNKHGLGRDDAVVVSEEWFTARNKATVFDLTSRSVQKLVSNFRKCIKVGTSPNLGRGQPLQMANEFAEHYTTLRKVPGNVKKMDDAFNAFLRMLTTQLKSSRLLDDDTRNAFVWKTVSEPKTEVEKLEAARRMLAKSGDNSAQVQAAIHSITVRLTNIAKGIK